MSVEATTPWRLPDLIEAFTHTTAAVVDLAKACTAADLARPTECPGWTVHDQISHVVGVESWLAGHKDPRVKMPAYEHIRNAFGKRVEYAVEVRRARTGPEVVAELEDVLAQRLSTLRSPAITDTSIVAGPFGPDTAVTVLRLRTFDVWAHEQDIRTALGKPGNLDSPAAEVFLGSVMHELPKLIAKGAGLEPGHLVRINVTGPLAAQIGVMVGVDEQGRLRGHAVSADEVPADEVPGQEATTVSLSMEAFTRRAAGRRSVSDTAYDVVGDDAIARRVLEALVTTP